MSKRQLIIVLLCFFALTTIARVATAAQIISATLDKNTYLAGQTGYISVTVYNDKSEKIRVTELSSTINYYYTDGTVYVQKFYTSATLPDEIPAGESSTYQVPISLPTNIAPGYINPRVEAYTEIWRSQDERWGGSDHPTYSNLKLYIESSYKQLYESSQEQLQEQETANADLSSMRNLLAATTLVFALTAASLMFYIYARKASPAVQPQ